jgi:hypothetical protein
VYHPSPSLDTATRPFQLVHPRIEAKHIVAEYLRLLAVQVLLLALAELHRKCMQSQRDRVLGGDAYLLFGCRYWRLTGDGDGDGVRPCAAKTTSRTTGAHVIKGIAWQSSFQKCTDTRSSHWRT